MSLSQKVLATSGEVIILKIHGFHATKHAGYPQAVFGLGSDARPVQRFGSEMEDALVTSNQGWYMLECNGDLKALCAKKMFKRRQGAMKNSFTLSLMKNTPE